MLPIYVLRDCANASQGWIGHNFPKSRLRFIILFGGVFCYYCLVDLEVALWSIFRNESWPISSKLHKIIEFGMQVSRAMALQNHIGSTQCFKNISLISWSPPRDDYVVLNSDGSFKGVLGTAGGEELSEIIWGNGLGLSLAQRRSFRKLIIQSDPLIAVKWLNKEFKCNSLHENMVNACLDLLELDWDVSVVHIYRKNGVFIYSRMMKYRRVIV
ncbi:conserved hypothetical protein [Ricinus communis]|uniref:RNase H type-1 domain-containing protein n=1 Tax=Ricinus communis TaxID=3988 RepID=B9RZH2_RICCO|nr:conserved hypothetical protein [Ricinus communis]